LSLPPLTSDSAGVPDLDDQGEQPAPNENNNENNSGDDPIPPDKST